MSLFCLGLIPRALQTCFFTPVNSSHTVQAACAAAAPAVAPSVTAPVSDAPASVPAAPPARESTPAPASDASGAAAPAPPSPVAHPDADADAADAGTPVAVSRAAVLVRPALDALRQSPVGRRVEAAVRALSPARDGPSLRVTRSSSGSAASTVPTEVTADTAAEAEPAPRSLVCLHWCFH